MEYKISELIDTDDKHYEMVDSTIYSLVAKQMAEFTDSYMLIHIQKPAWCSKWLYHFFIKNFVNITHFKKH